MSGEAARRFDRLLADYYHAWFRHHPVEAVEAGVDEFADRLPPLGDDDIGALRGLNERLLDGLEALDFDALDADRRIDWRLAAGAALIENHELRESDWRYHDPLRGLPVEAIHQLFLRPVGDLAEAVAARLEAVPERLREARGFLVETPDLVPLPWLEAAVAEARAGAGWLRSLDRHPRLVGMRERHALLETAAAALEEHARFLDQRVRPEARGEVACGRAQFERLLRHRHFLEVSVAQLEDFGRREVAAAREALAEACRVYNGSDDVAAALARLRSEHPSPATLLGRYREAMQAARAFVAEAGLVSLPPRERLSVVETPVWLRHRIPFAAYVAPAPGDPEQQGWYFVTPPPDEDGLGEHHETAIRHTSVHEAWPGHHLQFVTANGRFATRSLPRLLNPSATLYEGWALYCEQLMHEQGFLEGAASRVVLAHDRLWRALRVLIDIDLHVHECGFETAVARLRDELGMPEAQARGEITWYSLAPTVPLGYAVGRALILALRTRLEAAPGFSLRAFHDALVGQGSMALALVARRAFGEEVWGAALQSVFGEETT